MDANGIGSSIGQFEKVFEDMEVRTGEMDAALENVYS